MRCGVEQRSDCEQTTGGAAIKARGRLKREAEVAARRQQYAGAALPAVQARTPLPPLVLDINTGIPLQQALRHAPVRIPHPHLSAVDIVRPLLF
jgi:hypothetical protein